MTNVMIWPDLQREDGHWLPAVTLAKTLDDAGYDVRMMGIPDTASIAGLYEIPFTEILAEFFPFGFARERLETGKTTISHWLPLARGELDAVFSGGGAPDLLVVGYFATFEALILHHKYDVPLVVLTTFLRHPDLLPALRVKAELLALPESVSAKLIELSAGEELTIDEFVQPLFEAQEILPMPKEFDFQERGWKHDPDFVTHVEPMVTRVKMDGSPLPTPTPEDVGYWHDLPETGELILGLCGSQTEVFEGGAKQLFASLIEMMKAPGMQGRHLVLAVGQKLFQEFTKTYSSDGLRNTIRLPSNVSLAAWVPQQELLTRAEAVFAHGGLATIKETIWEGVPLVVIPMVNDQFENALRVMEHDLGVHLPHDRITPESLREALSTAKSSPWLKRGTAKMKAVLEAADGAVTKKSVEVISGVVAP